MHIRKIRQMRGDQRISQLDEKERRGQVNCGGEGPRGTIASRLAVSANFLQLFPAEWH